VAGLRPILARLAAACRARSRSDRVFHSWKGQLSGGVGRDALHLAAKHKATLAEKSAGALIAGWKALQESPDILHLHSVVAGSLAPLLRYKGAPCVVHMHGLEWLRNRWGRLAKFVLKTMERTSLASADAITAVSQTQCEYFKDNYNLDCEYISTAADIKEFASPEIIRSMGIQPRKYVLFAARLVPEKGAHYLIEAFRRLSTDYSLIIAGEAPVSSGYGQQLLELAKGDERIRFLGTGTRPIARRTLFERSIVRAAFRTGRFINRPAGRDELRHTLFGQRYPGEP